MGLAHSPKVVTDGLVFYTDMNNTSKSWRGKPATNFFTNGHFSGGNGITQESGSNATNEIVLFPNPGSSAYVLRQTGTLAYTEYQLNLTTQLAAGTTYVMSGWYAESPNYSCADGSRMFHSAAFSASGATASLGIGIGTVLETKVVNGITWKYCYATITTPADYNNVFNWYVGYGGSAYTGHRFYTDLQMEVGTFPSRFVDGTRSTSQAILDMTRRSTMTASNLVYNSNNTFNFSYSGPSYITVPLSTAFNKTEGTMNFWVYPTRYNGGNGYFVNREDNIANAGDWFWIGPYSNTFYFRIGTGATCCDNDLAFSNVSTTIPINTWTNMCFTWKINGTSVIYKNGVELVSRSIGNIPNTNPAANGRIGLGHANADDYFDGRMPSVQIYNRQLTASEVNANFNATRGRYGI